MLLRISACTVGLLHDPYVPITVSVVACELKIRSVTSLRSVVKFVTLLHTPVRFFSLLGGLSILLTEYCRQLASGYHTVPRLFTTFLFFCIYSRLFRATGISSVVRLIFAVAVVYTATDSQYYAVSRCALTLVDHGDQHDARDRTPQLHCLPTTIPLSSNRKVKGMRHRRTLSV
jgi:hypothetical protein